LEKAYVKVTLTDFPDEIQSVTQKFKITFYKVCIHYFNRYMCCFT